MDGESGEVVHDGDYRGVVREPDAPYEGYLGNEEREVDGCGEYGDSGDEGREWEARGNVFCAGSDYVYPADVLVWIIVH
jgi:hypothetical protein